MIVLLLINNINNNIIKYMNKLQLIRNPIVFQGKKYLKKNKNYFEGWYFKNTSKNNNISFIPGININESEKKAFIQIITKENSYFINYDIEEFEYSNSPFYIKIGDNYFSEEKILLDINNSNIRIFGHINYSDYKNIETSFISPNIMGPFSYVPFMECNHAIIAMKCRVDGYININEEEIVFENNTGYIEKDWGVSFPKNYIWCQGNDFENSNAAFMLSIASIPLKIFSFKGIISSLIVDNKEYRFATYNNTKLIRYKIKNNLLDIVLKKGKYYLIIKSHYDDGLKLSAPVKGSMSKDIFESITSKITVTLKKNNKVLFSNTSTNCGLEIVQ